MSIVLQLDILLFCTIVTILTVHTFQFIIWFVLFKIILNHCSSAYYWEYHLIYFFELIHSNYLVFIIILSTDNKVILTIVTYVIKSICIWLRTWPSWSTYGLIIFFNCTWNTIIYDQLNLTIYTHTKSSSCNHYGFRIINELLMDFITVQFIKFTMIELNSLLVLMNYFYLLF